MRTTLARLARRLVVATCCVVFFLPGVICAILVLLMLATFAVMQVIADRMAPMPPHPGPSWSEIEAAWSVVSGPSSVVADADTPGPLGATGAIESTQAQPQTTDHGPRTKMRYHCRTPNHRHETPEGATFCSEMA